MEDDRISVCVRVRPPIGNEAYQPLCLRKAQNGQTIVLKPEENASNNGEIMQYQFDHVFDESDDQEVVYEECVQEMVDSALSGFNSTVFAYGQTGSGKTFTILGDTSGKSDDGTTRVSERSGVFLRVFDDLFRYRDSVAQQIHVKITLSIIELYVEDVLDLLANKKKLKLRDSSEETFALGITLVEVATIDEVLKHFFVANEFRSVSSTKMNENSSRSHALFFIDVYQFPVSQFPSCPPLPSLVDASGVPIPNAAPGMLRSRISLIDLAGSERVKKSGVSGQSMTEAQAINKSLSTLGTVINAMYTKNAHIPFRESKLTRLLKPCFVQANSRLLLIGQASPPSSSAVESLGTLRFCDRVKGLEAPATSGFLDPEEEERYLATKRKNHELCADLRIARVLHYHRPVRVQSLAESRRTSVDAERHRVEAELRQSAPLVAQREEERIQQEYTLKMAAERDREVEAFILKMNNLIEEYEQVAKAVKAEKKAWKKQKEELDAQVENETHEAKKAKKARVKLQEQIIALRDGNAALDASLKVAPEASDKFLNFDDPDPGTGALPASSNAGGAVYKLSDAEEDQLVQLVEEFGRQGAESARVISTYMNRLASTRECRAEVRRMKMRSSAIVSEGTTVDDLIHFMIDRAVDIAQGNVPDRIGWSWKDVDGCRTRLKGPTELYPPLLPRSRPNAYKRIIPSNTVYHRKTFLSSDDSDEENSHYPLETRRRRNLGAEPSGVEDLLLQDIEGESMGKAAVPPPAVASASFGPGAALGGVEERYPGGYAPGEEAEADDDGSSVDSDDEALASQPVVAGWNDGPDLSVQPPALPVPAPSLLVPTPALPVPSVPAPPAPEAASPASSPDGSSPPPVKSLEGGEKEARRRRRHHHHSDTEGSPAAIGPSKVTIEPSPHNALSTADDIGDDENEVEPEVPRAIGGSLSVSGMIEEMRRRRRKHRKDKGGAAAEQGGDASPDQTVAPNAEEETKEPDENEAGVVPRSKEEEDRMYLMKVYDSPTLVADLVKFLRGGTVMLKHGRMGKPHRRLFWVSSAHGRPELFWMDPDARNADRPSVKLDDVAFIKLGSFSKVFKRHPVKPPSDAFFRCFTIGLKNGGRTVDIVADTVADYEAWVVGLSWMIGVDPCWGGKPDITKEPGFDKLTYFESNLCEGNYIMPQDYLALKKEVLRRIEIVRGVLERCNNNALQAQRELGMFHPPKFNEKGAMLMTKGELRFLLPELKLDIFRISFIWIQLEQLNLIYDPNFTPATSFGVTYRQ